MNRLIRFLYVLASTNSSIDSNFDSRIGAYCKYTSILDQRSLSIAGKGFALLIDDAPQKLLNYILNTEEYVRITMKHMQKISETQFDGGFMEEEIGKLLDIVKARTKKGSRNFYKPLPKAESTIIRDYYQSQLEMDVDGNDDCKIYNKEGTLIATGYKRVATGDYGAYVEFEPRHMQTENIEQRWPGTPKRKVKYIWMQTRDESRTKIYWQRGTVAYADYIVDMYYAAPEDVVVEYG